MWYYNLKYFDGDGFVPGVLRVENGVFQAVRRGEVAVSADIAGGGQPGTDSPAADSGQPGTDSPAADSRQPGTDSSASGNQAADSRQPGVPDDTIDLAGTLVIPGLVDIHVHGAAGADFSDGDEAGLRRMAAYLASRGITGFLPTSMTLPEDELARAFRTVASLRAQSLPGCARILGIRMEGPFLSAEKKGAQNADYLQAPDLTMFRKLQEGCGGLIRIVDVAPELEGAEGFVRVVSGTCLVSLAHTEASYEQAAAAFDIGGRHLTHLFNAMSGIHHREPGVIGAAAEREQITAELIADGYHVHPSAVRLAFRMFPGRLCLVSDAAQCCGMPEGEYELGGQQIRLAGGVAWLVDSPAGAANPPASSAAPPVNTASPAVPAGPANAPSAPATIACAASDLAQDLKNAIAFGIPAARAINAATIIPARVAGWADKIGSIEEGKYADFLVCDPDLTVRQVVIGGELL